VSAIPAEPNVECLTKGEKEKRRGERSLNCVTGIVQTAEKKAARRRRNRLHRVFASRRRGEGREGGKKEEKKSDRRENRRSVVLRSGAVGEEEVSLSFLMGTLNGLRVRCQGGGRKRKGRRERAISFFTLAVAVIVGC